jgi:TonB family protein
MSSIRIAVASFLLAGSLGASAWAQAPAAPPRDPISAETHHRRAVQDYDKARTDTSLTPEEKQQAILRGIAAENRALAINPDYIDALVYKNILLRMQAALVEDGSGREQLIKEADEVRNKALALGASRQGRGFLIVDGMRVESGQVDTMSPEFKALIDQLQPLRVGGNIRTPTKIKDVKPVFPAEAQAARVQGVVILETIIDVDGHVRAARVLRSIPMLDDPALGAVRQWIFTPTLLNGAPVAVLMTVTVNFTLQ